MWPNLATSLHTFASFKIAGGRLSRSSRRRPLIRLWPPASHHGLSPPSIFEGQEEGPVIQVFVLFIVILSLNALSSLRSSYETSSLQRISTILFNNFQQAGLAHVSHFSVNKNTAARKRTIAISKHHPTSTIRPVANNLISRRQYHSKTLDESRQETRKRRDERHQGPSS